MPNFIGNRLSWTVAASLHGVQRGICSASRRETRANSKFHAGRRFTRMGRESPRSQQAAKSSSAFIPQNHRRVNIHFVYRDNSISTGLGFGPNVRWSLMHDVPQLEGELTVEAKNDRHPACHARIRSMDAKLHQGRRIRADREAYTNAQRSVPILPRNLLSVDAVVAR